MWEDFAARRDFGGRDSGIDLVAQTHEGDYWAIQCKCYAAETLIDKPAVDSFLATSSREFLGDDLRTTRFKHRLWISTTHRWGPNAEEAIRNQSPPVSRIGLYDLTQAPVEWARLERDLYGAAARAAQKTIRPHQQKALEATHAHFQTADRGKLIMACGTGKTYTALKIAEHETQGQGLVLFLVPSIALMGQTLREWTAEASVPLEAICICSDAKVTRKRTRGEDGETGSVIDLALPASTDVDTIVRQIQAQWLAPKQGPKQGMTVVFSTYQSIEVVAKAQAAWRRQNATSQTHGTGLADGIFDLVICDEAHRTTGVTLASDDESSFVRVHDNAFLQARKRLYMTATPRLYSDDSKSKAAQANAELCSMDDVRLYGAEIYRIGFGEAVEKSLLTDYKVIVLTMNEADVPKSVQAAIADPNNEISTDDASKLIGCINALSKKILGDAGILSENDPEPMRRAVAFCQSIEASKKIMSTFNNTGAVYLEAVPAENRAGLVNVVVDHVDGTMSALTRDEKLAWLKETPNYETNTCRILSNARCLSEGVDVPSLDAVLFLSARNSQVDVVQSVGRVMRRAEGKKYGYIIIPVVFPNHVKPEDALNDNERFKVVWSVLNALRAHDDRFNATVNKIELNRQRPSQILVGGVAHRSEAQDGAANTAGAGQAEQPSDAARAKIQQQMALQFGELQNAIFAKMVQKVGDRRYWEQWAANVAEIAERYVARITRMVAETGPHQAAFEAFLDGLRRNINPAIMPDEAIEMLAQHVITKPVFEALFEGYSFVQHNPVSQAMQHMLEVLEAQSLEKDAASLDKFYESVRKRASGIDNAEGKQRIIIELYDKFFRTAFPKLVEKLGIVYTPVKVVDFIIHSVDDVLRREFGCGLSDEQVHILDPFTGTGTFMTRLLQSGLIKPEDLARKYAHELHANEIVLLAYYIAAINIENAYHDQVGMGDGVLGVGDRV
jgi:predicted helicase